MRCIPPHDLSAFLDGELSSRRRHQIDRHLTGCERCSRELSQLREVVALVRESESGSRPVRPGFHARLSRRLEQEEAQAWQPLRLGIRIAAVRLGGWPVTVAAVAGIAGLAAWGLGSAAGVRWMPWWGEPSIVAQDALQFYLEDHLRYQSLRSASAGGSAGFGAGIEGMQ